MPRRRGSPCSGRAGSRGADLLSLPGSGLRLRPERMGDAGERARRESDAVRQLLRRPDRDRRQDEAARTSRGRRDPRQGTELPCTRGVQRGRVVEGEARDLGGEGPALPPAHGLRRLRVRRRVGDQ